MNRLPEKLQNWVKIQSTMLIVMMVITALSGFILLILRSKLPLTWDFMDKGIGGNLESILLLLSLLSLFYLICYYQILERKKYVYYIQLISIIITFVFIFPIALLVNNFKMLLDREISAFYIK
jgi:hypothetical protein